MVGLHYLKSIYNVSDEAVVAQFVENPYWQYFCGYEYFFYSPPCNATSLVHWRKRFGEAGFEELLKETIEAAKRADALKEQDLNRVNVDTTVQEKAITFPTDAKLYHKMRRKLVKAAKRAGIELRQSYERLGQQAFVMQGRYGKARQMKAAARETRKLRVYLGRVTRDIKRKCPEPNPKLKNLLDLAERIFKQGKKDRNKVYSIHAPEVECIAKGKAHKKYEFGNKVSVVSTSQGNWCVGVQSFHGNPYDGQTLKEAINQSERLTGVKPKHVHVDKGYKGVEYHPEDVEVHLPVKKEKLSRAERKHQARRNAVESVISHLKLDHRMDRNFLLGEQGDKINALLAGCGYNLKKLMRAFSFANFFVFLSKIWIELRSYMWVLEKKFADLAFVLCSCRFSKCGKLEFF
jgi:IS5 family transposase